MYLNSASDVRAIIFTQHWDKAQCLPENWPGMWQALWGDKELDRALAPGELNRRRPAQTREGGGGRPPPPPGGWKEEEDEVGGWRLREPPGNV